MNDSDDSLHFSLIVGSAITEAFVACELGAPAALAWQVTIATDVVVVTAVIVWDNLRHKERPAIFGRPHLL